jgi:kynurenine formamidase
MYIDLTHNFNNSMPVFPGDPGAVLVKTSDVLKGGITHFDIKTGMHVGTHMDAPSHMLVGGKNLHEYSVKKFFGRGVVLDARGKSKADVDLLNGITIKAGDIVLVCFGWSSEFNSEQYYLNYPEITPALAKKIVELGVSIIGMDSPSPDRAPYEVHKIFLPADVLIVENLTNLEQLIGKTDFEVIALPTKFEAEAAHCRVVAKIN